MAVLTKLIWSNLLPSLTDLNTKRIQICSNLNSTETNVASAKHFNFGRPQFHSVLIMTKNEGFVAAINIQAREGGGGGGSINTHIYTKYNSYNSLDTPTAHVFSYTNWNQPIIETSGSSILAHSWDKQTAKIPEGL